MSGKRHGDADYAERLACPLLGTLTGILLYELLSGLAVTFGPPAARWTQFGVILHTLAGIAMLAPFIVYAWRHVARTNSSPDRTGVWVGYASLAFAAVSLLSGLWAAAAASFQSAVPEAVRLSHSWTSYAASVLLAYHLARTTLRLRQPGTAAEKAWLSGVRRWSAWTAGTCLVLCVVNLSVPAFISRPTSLDGLPAGYNLRFGLNPFAPSNATTTSGTVIDSRRLSGSEGCGDCHQEIYKEWKASAHRWSSTDIGYRAVEGIMIKEMGQEATRYCAACHDPVSLLSGGANPGAGLDTPGSDEGSSCLTCHSITGLNGTAQGNGNYIIRPRRDYLFAGYKGKLAKDLEYFLIRSFPRAHDEDLSSDFQATPEFCSTCHKQFIDREVNNFGWVQLQNQYDDWRKGHYHKEGHPKESLICQQCHMRLTDSKDPARGQPRDPLRGRDDKHRNHRFIGANQAIPWLAKDLEQMKLTEDWLQGRTDIPEIASVWAKGPAVPIRVEAPEKALPGGKLKWRVVVTSNKVGHTFPTGPLDIIETWLEVHVTDAKGRVVYRSGDLDARKYVDKDAFFFQALGMDQHGKLIDRHNLWNMVGQKKKRSLFVGYSDVAPYEAVIPRGAAGPLTVSARLRYRKFNQFITDVVSNKSGLTFPVTDISTSSATVPLGRAAGTPQGGR